MRKGERKGKDESGGVKEEGIGNGRRKGKERKGMGLGEYKR